MFFFFTACFRRWRVFCLFFSMQKRNTSGTLAPPATVRWPHWRRATVRNCIAFNLSCVSLSIGPCAHNRTEVSLLPLALNTKPTKMSCRRACLSWQLCLVTFLEGAASSSTLQQGGRAGVYYAIWAIIQQRRSCDGCSMQRSLGSVARRKNPNFLNAD